MHWQRHKGGAQHYRVAERLGNRLEVAVALSPEPVLDLLRDGADAGRPRRAAPRRVSRAPADRDGASASRSISRCPASAHIVLEGYVEPGERRREGPFGDHTGFYSQPDDFPVFHLTCITRRKRPTYLTTIVGDRRRWRTYYLGMASERIFLPHDPEDASRDRRHAFSGRGHLSQPGDRLDRQALSGPRPQDHERVLGTRSADVLEDHRRRRQGRQRARRPRGRVDRRHAHGSAARRADDSRAGRRSRRCRGPAGLRRKDGHRRDAEVGVGGLQRSWPARIRTTEDAGRRAAELWARLGQGRSGQGGEPGA